MLKDDVSKEIYAFKSTMPIRSLQCRVLEAFNTVFRKIFLGILGTCIAILFAFGVFYAIKKRKDWILQEEMQVFKIIKEIIDILEKHQLNMQSNPQIDPLPMVHVRDMVIPLSQRSQKNWQKMWEKVLKFISENESRIRPECQIIDGEDYIVWRWLGTSTPEDSKKGGRIWQGQAFTNSSINTSHSTPPISPTPCLKIRNMFDPEIEYGDNWPTNIKDAILEKCEGNYGIVHIHIHSTSKEGCVYLKCSNPTAARQAYDSLHGWWFDRNLVTVKYVRLSRYHERFPESVSCTIPLKPSNNKRLSLPEPSCLISSLEN